MSPPRCHSVALTMQRELGPEAAGVVGRRTPEQMVICSRPIWHQNVKNVLREGRAQDPPRGTASEVVCWAVATAVVSRPNAFEIATIPRSVIERVVL